MVPDNGCKDHDHDHDHDHPHPHPLVDITYEDNGAYSVNINIRRVAETQMVSVRNRNIQGRYNSVRHLHRRYPELLPLRVVSIVTSSVPISLENTKTTRT